MADANISTVNAAIEQLKDSVEGCYTAASSRGAVIPENPDDRTVENLKEVITEMIPEKEQLLNYFRRGGTTLQCFNATEEYDLDLSQIPGITLYVRDGSYNIEKPANVPYKLKINGSITFPEGLSFGRYCFRYLYIKGNLTARNSTIMQDAFGGYIENKFDIKGGRVFQHGWVLRNINAKYIDCSNFTIADVNVDGRFLLALAEAPGTRLEWIDYTGIDFVSSLQVTSASFAFFGRNFNLLTSLIGEKENEPYDETLTVMDNYSCTNFDIYRAPNIGWKSLMALSKGFYDLTANGIDTKTIVLSTTHQTTLQNAGMLETFEQTLTDKGWTIIYQ